MVTSHDDRERLTGPTASRWFGGLHQDLSFALRQVRLHPGFALAMALTLGLGMGVNTALFSVANALLLRPLPLPERDRLVGVYCLEKGFASHVPMSFADYRDLRAARRHFADLAAHAVKPFAIETAGLSEVSIGEFVTSNYFTVLGVPMALGRGFAPDEGDEPGTAAVAVLSEGAWRRRFAGDPTVLGRSLWLNGRSFTVIGVAPSSFRGLAQGFVPEFWVPVGAFALFGPEEDPSAVRRDRLDNRGGRWISVVGRLAPGSSVEDARQEVKAVARALSTSRRGWSCARTKARVSSVRWWTPANRPSIRGRTRPSRCAAPNATWRPPTPSPG